MLRAVMDRVGVPHIVVLGIVTLLALPGCSGSKMRPVHGKVHFPDGSPLTQGKVVVNAVEGLHGASSGPLDTDGSFDLSSLKKGDGVPIGKYRVSIVGAAEPPRSEAEIALPPRYLIDPRFLDPNKSGLTLEVTPDGENFLDITVEKPPPSRRR
jgi:hypothetical protein